jgi:hypothetical protein
MSIAATGIIYLMVEISGSYGGEYENALTTLIIKSS